MDYIAYLHKDRKSDFGVSFPDFPGCVTAGRTLEEAQRKAGEALALHIQGMAEDGEAIPKPSKIDAIEDDPARKDAVAFLVSANLERTIRVNITARESQLAKIDRLAGLAGMSRSAYIVQAAIEEGNHFPHEKGIPGATAAQAGVLQYRTGTEVRTFPETEANKTSVVISPKSAPLTAATSRT